MREALRTLDDGCGVGILNTGKQSLTVSQNNLNKKNIFKVIKFSLSFLQVSWNSKRITFSLNLSVNIPEASNY